MARLSIILHEMAGWKESADRPVLAGPVLRPGDIFPPPPPEPERRRRPRWPIWVAVAVVLAIGAGVVAYARSRPTAFSSADQVAAVRRAYLAWWGAAKQAYLHLDPSPMRKYMTDAGYKQESEVLAQQHEIDQPIDIEVPSHDLQVAIDSGGAYASVDDIWKSDDVSLDPSTGAPTSQPTGDSNEESTVMKLEKGEWRVDSRYDFGASSNAVSGTMISWAAAPAGVPQPTVRAQVTSAFENFKRARRTAYLDLDPSLLRTVETDPYLGVDLQHLAVQKAKHQPVNYAYQDNFRLGVQGPSHVWIYDTVLDHTAVLGSSNRRPVQTKSPSVVRFEFSLRMGAQGWMVDAVGIA